MKLFKLLSSIGLVLASTLDSSAQGFSISPARIFLTGNPGETLSTTINISNSSDQQLSFNTRLQDWDRDSTGTKIYYASGTKPNSNSNWVSLTTNTVTIGPGETIQAALTMHVPNDARATTNSMLFFTQIAPQEKNNDPNKKIGINVLMEVGVQLYYIPPALNHGDLEFIDFQDFGLKSDSKVRKVALKIHNTGAINKDAFVRMELTNKETGEEIKIAAVPLAMLPEATQWVYIELPTNLKGNYLAVALLDAGKSYDLKVAEKEIIYTP